MPDIDDIGARFDLRVAGETARQALQEVAGTVEQFEEHDLYRNPIDGDSVKAIVAACRAFEVACIPILRAARAAKQDAETQRESAGNAEEADGPR